MKSFAIIASILFLALNLARVSANLAASRIKPANDFSVRLNGKVSLRARVKPANGSTSQVAEVKFFLEKPNGNVSQVVGKKKGKKGNYIAKKKLKIAGTWRWKMEATADDGTKKIVSWRNIVVGDATPTTPTPPTPTPPTPTPPTPTPPTTGGEPPIDEVADEIRSLFRNDRDLRAKLLRLGFHMCVGGCDGCVDMTNADNQGLDIPIDAIASIVTDYQGRISRADIWAIATLVAVEDSQNDNSEISFPLEWYGRTDCDSANGKTGPAQALPSPDLTTHQLLEFFTTDFGLSTRETVALMGAHTTGELNRENSGFNGPNGWSNNNVRLNNGYYDSIIGGDEEDNTLGQTDFETLFNAPNWDFEEVNNSAFPGIPNRRVWTRGGNGNTQTLMLNSDMALVRDLSGHVDPSTGEVGEVTCRFKGRRSPCPHAQQTFDIAAEFKYDFDQWRIEFRDVLGKMLLAGNDTTATCSSPPCQLP